VNKRPIDRKRESAGMIDIEDPDDPSGITGLKDVWVSIKHASVMAFPMARR
jgi:hypothetical protein